MPRWGCPRILVRKGFTIQCRENGRLSASPRGKNSHVRLRLNFFVAGLLFDGQSPRNSSGFEPSACPNP